MTFNRKTFLKRCGVGLAGLGLGRVSATAASSVSSPTSNGFSLPAWDAKAPEGFWAAARQAYEFEPGLHYFNTGGLGPCPTAVRIYVERMAAEMESIVETGHGRLEAAREKIAEFMGCATDEVSCVRNTTEGTGIIAGGLDLERGDEVIFESHAHPGGSFPWLLQAQQKGIAVRLFEPDSESVEGNVARIEALITSRTKVVQVSHVTAPTGIKLPVERIAAICRKRGLWFHVDGAQTTGMLPINFAAMGCDSYATSGHKWLGAPRETGLLLVKRSRQDLVVPPLAGAYTADIESLPSPLAFTPNASRYEYGTRDIAKIEGMVEAMRWHETIGRDHTESYGRELVTRLRAGLVDVPDLEILSPSNPSLSSPILTLRSSRLGYQELFGALWRTHHMRCRPVSEQGLDAVRVSCHVFNSTDEIDRLVVAIKKELAAV
jgi:selenocysteine lyase/cysteine desulfurase